MNHGFRNVTGKLFAVFLLSTSLVMAGCMGGGGSASKNRGSGVNPPEPVDGSFAGVFADLRLLYLTTPELATPNNLYALDVNGRARVISHEISAGSAERITGYAGSPNQRHVAYTTTGGDGYSGLRIVNLDTAENTRVYDNPANNASNAYTGEVALNWDASGDRLLFRGAVSAGQWPNAYVWDAASKRRIAITGSSDSVITRAIWSPDYSHVVYTASSAGGIGVYSFRIAGYSPGMSTAAYTALIAGHVLDGASVTALGVAADGSHVHVVTDGGNLHVLSMAMAPVVTGVGIMDAQRGTGQTPVLASWSDTGARIAYVNAAGHLAVSSPGLMQTQVFNNVPAYAFAWGAGGKLAFVSAGNVTGLMTARVGIIEADGVQPWILREGPATAGTITRFRLGWVGDEVLHTARSETGPNYALYLGQGLAMDDGFGLDSRKMRAPETVRVNGSNLLFGDALRYDVYNIDSGGAVVEVRIGETLLQADWIKPGNRDNRILGLLTRGPSQMVRIKAVDAFGNNVFKFDVPVLAGEELVGFKPY